MAEQYRESLARTTVSTSGLKLKDRKKETAEWEESTRSTREAYVEAVRAYQVTATPLSEKVREIEVERVGAPPVAATVDVVDPVTRVVTEKKVRRRRLKSETKDIAETYEVAREELVAEGYRPEDIETPFVDLGGTAATGFKPPYVLHEMEEAAGVPVEERAPETEPYREPVERVKPVVEGLNFRADSGLRKLLFMAVVASIVKSLASK